MKLDLLVKKNEWKVRSIRIIKRGKNKMYKYTIYVTHKGKVYQTNVIATKNQTEEEIYRIAQEQVLKQWEN